MCTQPLSPKSYKFLLIQLIFALDNSCILNEKEKTVFPVGFVTQ